MTYVQRVAGVFRKARDRNLENLTRICFSHVPKCAGSVITEAIREQFSLKDKILHGSFSVNDQACIKAAQIFDEPRRNVRDRLIAYTMAEGRHTYIAGHFHCRPELVEMFRDDWHFVTVLRDPVERWISGYVYDRFKTAERGKVNEDIETFICSERGQYGGMTYLAYFSNIPKDPSFRPYEPFVDEAEENLKNFALVGMINKLDQFATDFTKITGKPLKIERGNTTPKQTAKAEIKNNRELMERIHELCEPDIALYNRIVAW